MTEKNDRRLYTLSEERPASAVVKMGVPLIAGMFIMVLYNLVDTYFIGRLHDDYQLAAVSLAYPVMMVMSAVSNMVGTGSASLIARCLGSGEREKAEHTLMCAWILTVINSLIVSAAGLLFLKQIAVLLGAQENTLVFTERYAGVILGGALFTMANYTLGQLLRSEGSVRYSVLGMVIGTLVNVVMDPVCIFVLGWGITGAAAATVFGNACGMCASLYFYARKKTLLRPSRAYLHLDRMITSEIYRVGIPASLETTLTSAAYVVNNNLAVGYGELTVAAMGIAQKIMSLGSYIYQGYAAGTQPVMGYCYGAKNYRRMLDVLKAGVIVTSVTELAVMALYGLFAPVWIGIFTGSESVIETGSRVLRTLMWILPFVGAVSMCRMSFQAMGKPQYAFIITLIRQLFLYIPLLLILNRLFGFRGMLCAQPFTEAIMMIVSVRLLAGMIRREEKERSAEAE